jgi:hypothetical protein
MDRVTFDRVAWIRDPGDRQMGMVVKMVSSAAPNAAIPALMSKLLFVSSSDAIVEWDVSQTLFSLSSVSFVGFSIDPIR